MSGRFLIVEAEKIARKEPLFDIELEKPDGKIVRLQVTPDEHILNAALEAGHDLPYRCLRGWCLSCAALLDDDGCVDQSDSIRYYPDDREEGFILLCTGRACSSLKAKTHQSEEMRKSRIRRGRPTPRGNWGSR